ncbi:MAG: malate synthase G, partial [Proteobacteria bacterium]|nr:malate synthase G [Pseudomonadota bacterium]
MTERVERSGLAVEKTLLDFIENQVLPGIEVTADDFWAGLADIVVEFGPRNAELMAVRDALQSKLDAWHRAHRDSAWDINAYRSFLTEIGYLVAEGENFSVTTANVDPEISTIAGPQLVVPLNNARYSLNAANARWGSLYDALYGTDAIAETDGAERGAGFNPKRGAKVTAFARKFLDDTVPLKGGSHADAERYWVADGNLVASLSSGRETRLLTPEDFAGFNGSEASPRSILLVHNGLHIEIVVDYARPIGKSDPAGIADVVIESAITTIMDCEDS